MNASHSTLALGWVALVLTAVGWTAVVAVTAYNTRATTRMWWNRYCALLDAQLRFLLSRTTGVQIATAQALVMASIPFFALLLDNLMLNLLLPVVAAGPYFYLTQRRDRRLLALEQQLDSWLLLLANALKASPSLGEAIEASVKLMRAPFSEEIDLVIKEMKLGTALDQAMMNMSRRIGSRVISSSLATILVGRTTGGDLPGILEQSAATLREMARLEGVVRTKTAEGKSQAAVLAVIPFGLLAMLNWMDPNWLKPLFENFIGNILLVVAIGLWVGAILLARKILAVDV